MTTVDGHLAMFSIDPRRAFDAAQITQPMYYVGTLEGSPRLGGILYTGIDVYTGIDADAVLRLSPRGQGTTDDGTEIVFKFPEGYTGTTFDMSSFIGRLAFMPKTDSELVRFPTNATGKVTVERKGDGYMIEVNAQLDGRPVAAKGLLENGLWK